MAYHDVPKVLYKVGRLMLNEESAYVFCSLHSAIPLERRRYYLQSWDNKFLELPRGFYEYIDFIGETDDNK